MAIARKVDLPRSPENLSHEFDRFNELRLKYSALTSVGNLNFESLSSGLLYESTTGEVGLLDVLLVKIGDSILDADGYNSIIDTITPLTEQLNQANRDIAQLYLQSAIDGKLPLTQSKFMQTPTLLPSNSLGSVDNTNAFCETVTQGADNVDITNMISGLVTDIKVGMELTLQNTPKEVLIVQSVVGNKVTFTSNVVNAYPDGASLYRSNLTNDWKFGNTGGAIGWDEDSGNPPSVDWRYLIPIGNKFFGRKNASPYDTFSYDINTKTWDETLSAPSGNWIQGVEFGTDIYILPLENRLWKYDTLLDSWDETLALASGAFTSIARVGTDIFARQSASPYAVWKYDTLLDSWDYSGAFPSGVWDNAVSIDEFLHVGSGSNMWKYDTINDTWDETGGTASGSSGSRSVMGTDIYSIQASSPYTLWKYDTISKTWDEGLDAPSERWIYSCVIGSSIFGKQYASPYTVFEYKTIGGNPTTDIDVRLNINPNKSVSNLQLWLLNNKLGVYSGFLSIVGESDNELYEEMLEETTEMTTQNEVFMIDDVATENSKVAVKINITRPNTSTDVTLSQIIGGVF